MASEAELANLFVTLRAVNAPILEGFSQTASAGEEMVATLNTAFAEFDATIARTGESLAALRDQIASVATSANGLSIDAGAGAAAATSGGAEAAATGAATAGAAGADVASGVGAAAAADATAAETASAEEQAAWDSALASFQRLSAEVTADSAEISGAWFGMASKVEADNAALVASAGEYGKSLAGVSAATDAAASAAPKWQTNLGSVSGSLVKVGAAGVILAGATVDMAAKFQSSTTRLITSGGELASNLQTDQQGILALSGQVGYSADDLSAAMYKITSAGQQGAQALTTLKAAAQGAKTENADLTTVADAVSTAMIDYKSAGMSAADVTSKLVAATSQGKTNFQDLAGAMSAILPKASAAHINFNEILGDLASMTQHGMSAQQSAENLADAISHMQNPTMAMSKEMAALGLNSTQLSQNLGTKGLSGTLDEVSQAVQKSMGGGATSVILNMQNALKGLPAPVQQLSQQVLDGSASWTQWNAATKDLTVTQRSQAQSFATLVNGMHTIGTQQLSGGQVMQTYAGAMAKATGDSASLNVALMLTGQNSGNTQKAISTVSKATKDAQGNVQGWSEIQGTFNQKLSEAKDGLEAAAISVGQKLLPVVTSIVSHIASFTTWLASNKTAAVALAGAIGVLLAGGVVGLGLKVVTLGAKLVGNLFKPITGGIKLVKNFAGGLKGVEGAASSFGGKLGIAAKAIGNWASSAGSAISSGAQWAGSMIAQGYQVSVAALKSAATSSGAWIASMGKQLATNASQAGAWAAGLARQYAATAGAAVKQAATATGAWLASTAKMVGQGIAQAASWVAGMVVKFTAVAVSAVVEAAATAGAWIAANIAMIAATGGIILLLGAVVAAAIYLGTHWKQVWDAIKEAATAVWHWIDGNIVQPLVAVWDTYIVPALHAFGQVWGDVWNGIKSAISAVWNFIKPIFDAIGNAVSGVVHAIGSVVNTIGSIGSGIGHLLGFDEGGWVPGGPGEARLAVVHGGEYVLSRDMLAGNKMPDIPTSGARGSGMATIVPVAASGGSGGGGGNAFVNVYVAGSVHDKVSLAQAVQQAVTQLSSRNSGFGTTAAFA